MTSCCEAAGRFRVVFKAFSLVVLCGVPILGIRLTDGMPAFFEVDGMLELLLKATTVGLFWMLLILSLGAVGRSLATGFERRRRHACAPPPVDPTGVDLDELDSSMTGECGVCRQPLAGSIAACRVCHSLQHQDCWAYAKTCPVFGCGGKRIRSPRKRARRDAFAVAMRGRMKRDSTNEDTNGVGLLLLIGAALFAWALWQNHRAVEKGANAAEWPETDGEVQYSYVDSERRGGGRYRPARDHYFPVVHYSYSVDGNGYSGSRVQFGVRHEPSSLSRVEVDRWIRDRWFPRMLLKVRYDPNDPAESVLIPGSP